MMIELPPALILMSGLLLIPFAKGIWRQVVVLLLPLLTLVAVWSVPDGSSMQLGFLNYTLEPVTVTPVGRLFATIFSLVALIGGLFALQQARTLELAVTSLYAGSAIGVTFAGDWLTLFVFWELMAIGSTAVIWAANTEASYRASIRYLMIHLL